MKNLDLISVPLVVAMLIGALVCIPMLGLWPLLVVISAVASTVWFVLQLP